MTARVVFLCQECAEQKDEDIRIHGKPEREWQWESLTEAFDHVMNNHKPDDPHTVVGAVMYD